MRDVLAEYKCVTYICDKRFLLALMFIDFAVELFYYEREFNLYADGGNYGMASLLYKAGPTLLGSTKFDRMMVSFQRAVKYKTADALTALVQSVRATEWSELKEILGPLAVYAAPECLKAIATPGVSTDAAMVVLLSLISRMEVMASGPYRVEHDQSKNLETYHNLLQNFIRHDDVVQFRATEITSLSFPLKLTDVKQVDSRQSPAVQLADMMIGAAIEAGNSLAGLRSGGLDPEQVMKLYGDDQFIHLLPSTDFEEQRRFRQETQNNEIIDYIAANIIESKPQD
jgi:hypothetical protein